MRRAVMLALVVGGLLALAVHLLVSPPSLHELIPATTYTVELDVWLEGYGDEIHVRTFLPVTDERQLVVDEEVEDGNLLFSKTDRGYDREARWTGDHVSGPRHISYRADVAPHGVKYELPPDLPRPTDIPPALLPYLAETQAIQVSHPEISGAWRAIEPRRASTTDTLRAIFDFTHRAIEGAEFKGTTDALTALRLGQASCNGKSRLFVALARRAGLPARLVGGLILEPGRKKTSHQWVEVDVAGRWVPFCPTNGYFAELPHHYLVLYHGDQALFAHTRNINFDYRFDIARRLEPGAGLRFASVGAEDTTLARGPARLFGVGHDVSRIFLLFPVAALLVIVFKNVVGLETFGVFLPMLIAAACRHTGLGLGLAAFLVVITLAAVVSRAMDSMRILQAPRLSVLITVITLTVLVAVALVPDGAAQRLALLGMFPPVILGFTGERLGKLSSQRDWLELGQVVVSTLFIIAVCYLALGSSVLQTLLVGFPELLLLVVAAQMAVGRWTGLRLTEHLRFGGLAPDDDETGDRRLAAGVLGINARNLDVLDPLNPSELVEIADDKLQTKQALCELAVPVPETLAVVRHSADVQQIVQRLEGQDEFVIKPSRGSGGNGVLVVTGRWGEMHTAADGTVLDHGDLRRHLTDVLSGIYSDGRPDQALVEERIHPDGFFESLSGSGLADLRVLLVRGEIVAAMLRLPTVASGGRANLHQGAIGVPVWLHDGVTGPAQQRRRMIERHPDSGSRLDDRFVPQWEQVLHVSRQAQRAIPLGYVGVDVCVDRRRGPLVLEVNARPGLEIQNVRGRGLRLEIAHTLQSKEPPTWPAG